MDESVAESRPANLQSRRQFSLRAVFVLIALTAIFFAYQFRPAPKSHLLEKLRVGDSVLLRPIGSSNTYGLEVNAPDADCVVNAIHADHVELAHKEFLLDLPTWTIHYIKRDKAAAGQSPAPAPRNFDAAR